MADNPRAWLRNEGSFPMVDPESGVRFEPQTAVRAELTTWVLTQPAIQRCTDPNDDKPSEKDVQKVAELNAADEQARQERERAAERIQRLANGKIPLDDVPAAAAAAAGKA
jgi:hypothetical protein